MSKFNVLPSIERALTRLPFGMVPFGMVAVCFIAASVTAISAMAEEVDIIAPVRLLGDPQPVESMNMLGQPAPPPPQTLVRGLLPQYQASQAFRSDAAMEPNFEEPTTRFFLAIPDRLLLLEATITTNGQPFEMVRERRIDMLLAELSKPEPVEPPAPEPPAPEPPAPEPPAPEPPLTTTETAAADSPAPEDAAAPTTDAAESEREPEVPLIAVPSDALESRLRRYATITGRPPTRDEVRWLLTKWVHGPTLLLLDANFQRFRGTQAPAFYVLDRDMDGKISAAEAKNAQQALAACDVNQNDVVEYTEIAEIANDPRRPLAKPPIQALVPIGDAALVAKSVRRLIKEYGSAEPVARFDTNADGQIDAAEFARLGEMEPDVSLAIAFNTHQPDHATIRVTRMSSEFGAAQARHRGAAITMAVGTTLVEFSAIQVAALHGSDQISLGVVNDGYPLLPALDPNNDGRLTIRELRQVVDRILLFDANQDGDITADEIPSTVRVAFGLGPSVHRHLSDIRTVNPPPDAPRIEVPDWFTRMDRNKDGDISRREFLFGPEKFRQLDADADDLISPEEAVALNEDASPTAQQEPATNPEEVKATP